MIDLTDVTFVHRVVVGGSDPENPTSDDAIASAMNELNRCLHETPHGRLIGIEKRARSVRIGGQEAALQHLVYHIGFTRRPHWLAA